MQNYQKLVRAVVFKTTVNFNLAEFSLTEDDLIQEGNLALMKAIKTFKPHDGRAKFETYASVCIKNRILDILRSQTTDTNVSVDIIPENFLVTDYDYLDLAIKRDILDKALKMLPGIERAIFNSYMEGHSYAEISKIFEIAPKKIDNTIQKIKSLVKP